MSDHDHNSDPKKTLSEISHLFLSSIRDKQTNGAPRPQRKAPAAVEPAQGTDKSVDLTPDEFAQVHGGFNTSDGGDSGPAGAEVVRTPRKAAPISAVIASHLNGKQFDRVKEYARHLAGQYGRIGLIELDASELRVMCFEPGATPADLADAAAASAQLPESYDPRKINEAIEELGWDVERWVVLLTTPRVAEAKALLRQIDHWVLLTTCDHDGVVSAYRTLKGLAEPAHPPRLSLALLDGPNEPELVSVYHKLAGVCQQFLGLRLHAESPVRRSFRIAEHLVLLCRPNRDKAQMANPPQWGILGEFLARSKASAAPVDAATESLIDSTEGLVDTVEEAMREIDDSAKPAAPFIEQAAARSAAAPAIAASAGTVPQAGPASSDGYEDVVELSDGGTTAEAVLSAVLRQSHGNFVECPVRAPMCDDVRLAVSRDRGIVLFAIAREGLGELRSIGHALRWVSENRTLLGMALPQFAIDANQFPRLRLLVDQSDLGADLLQPVLQSEHVTVQSYRKLRWGARTGLLLDAA